MHWRAATEVCAAVLLFAWTGRGVTIERTDFPGEIRLVSHSGVALARADAAARILHVRRVFGR